MKRPLLTLFAIALLSVAPAVAAKHDAPLVVAWMPAATADGLLAVAWAEGWTDAPPRQAMLDLLDAAALEALLPAPSEREAEAEAELIEQESSGAMAEAVAVLEPLSDPMADLAEEAPAAEGALLPEAELLALDPPSEAVEQLAELDDGVVTLPEGDEMVFDEYTPAIEARVLLELEARWRDPYRGGDSSDIMLATAALGVQAPFSDWFHGQVTFLYEDPPNGEATQDLDELYLAVYNTYESPFHLRAGRAYLPFGIYQTFMISDPLTLALGEVRPVGLQLGFEEAGFYGAAYLFNGETHLHDETGMRDFGLNLGYLWLGLDTQVDVGVDYLHSLSESRRLQEAIVHPDQMEQRAAGGALHGSVIHGPFTLLAEYVAATEAFHPDNLAFNGSGAQPVAWSLEAGYSFQVAGLETTFAIGHQQTREALALGLPQSRALASLSAALFRNSALTLEYARDRDYDSSDYASEVVGSGSAAQRLTLQLATQF